jgi:protein required for attachment to host cells
MIDAAARDSLAPQRRPREQLLVCEDGGEMALALFIDPRVLANLAEHDPSSRLGDHNLGDFLLAVEGVSHFIYASWCAQAERPVTQMELELQAEVDKYVTCLLATEAAPTQSETLRRRLFGDASYEPDLDHEERARYEAANDNANRYAAYLEDTFVSARRIPEMLGELRRFYRQGLAAKLATIARAA